MIHRAERARRDIREIPRVVCNGAVRLPDGALAWTLAATALLAAVQSARLWWLRALPRRRLRRVAERGAAGETRAEGILARHGYAIDARQAAQRFAITVDGEEVAVMVRADFLVTRGGRRFVAEVKTGEAAPRPEHPPTRRQLLEYRHAFDVDGVLLVHAEAERVQEVEFPPAPVEGAPSRLAWLAVGALLGAAAALLATSR